MRALPFAIALTALSATVGWAQDAPTQDAQAGAVKKTDQGVCMEPGHPAYTTATVTASYPSMRACFLEGGRRDTLTNTPPPGPAAPLGTVASTDAAAVPPQADPDAPNTTGPKDAVPADPTQPAQLGAPPGAPPSNAADALEEGVASTQQRRRAQPGAPKGITLLAQPSYSETPGLFRPPGDYFGRGPENFWP